MHEDQGITNRAHFKKVKACKIYKHMPHIDGDILVHIRHYVRGTVYICACSSMCVEEDSLFPKSTPWFPFISSFCPVIAPPPLPHAFLFLSSLTINSYNPSLPYLCFSGAPSFKISSSIDFFIPPDLVLCMSLWTCLCPGSVLLLCLHSFFGRVSLVFHLS